MTITSIRWGGRAGIAAVCLFVIGTLLITLLRFNDDPPPGDAPPPLTDTQVQRELPQVSQDNRDTIPTLLRSILSPLLFMAVLYAFKVWMAEYCYAMSDWVYHVGVIGIILWVISGIIRVFLLARLANSANSPIATDTGYSFMWLMASDSFFDAGFFVISLHASIAGLILIRAGQRWIGGIGVISSVVVMALLLLNSYEDFASYFAFVYAMSVIWLFFLSALMLLQADKLEHIKGMTPTQ